MDRAHNVSGIAQALSPQPLLDFADYERFYGERFESPEADSTAIMQLELNKSYGGVYYRRFLTGHSGTGKSTELTRLSFHLKDRFEFLRLSAQNELSPFSTQPFDVLEIMAVRLVERVRELGVELDEDLLERVHKWFAEVTETSRTEDQKSVQAQAEAGAGVPALLQILRLAAAIKGEAKFSSSRSEQAVSRRLQRLSELKDLSNDLFSECNRRLMDKYHREWVFLIEDFDKQSVAEQVLQQLFVRYSNVWSDLRIHLICTVPLWLAFGEQGAVLPFRCRTLVDIPVFGPDHQPHVAGRRILQRILDKRVDADLYAPGVKEYLIQAGGGNLRDMFSLVTEAANFAELLGKGRIEMPQAIRAVNSLRNEYLRRLGETSPQQEIPYEKKAELLVAIYGQGGNRIVQDPVLYRLLRSRVVHEYNNEYWYGLPPLVVDILIQQGRLDPESRGGLEPPPALP